MKIFFIFLFLFSLSNESAFAKKPDLSEQRNQEGFRCPKGYGNRTKLSGEMYCIKADGSDVVSAKKGEDPWVRADKASLPKHIQDQMKAFDPKKKRDKSFNADIDNERLKIQDRKPALAPAAVKPVEVAGAKPVEPAAAAKPVEAAAAVKPPEPVTKVVPTDSKKLSEKLKRVAERCAKDKKFSGATAAVKTPGNTEVGFCDKVQTLLDKKVERICDQSARVKLDPTVLREIRLQCGASGTRDILAKDAKKLDYYIDVIGQAGGSTVFSETIQGYCNAIASDFAKGQGLKFDKDMCAKKTFANPDEAPVSGNIAK